MSKNELSVDLKEFNHAMKIFKVGMERKNAKKKQLTIPAMLSFNDGFLSIESDDKIIVMRATGEWNGKAQFSQNTIKALALVPPNINPVIISYADERISIATMKVGCDWETLSKGMLDKLNNPNPIDIFAMWRTQPAVELRSKGIDKQHKQAQEKMMKITASASKKLEEFEITQQDLLNLIEAKVKAKISI